MNTRHWMRFSGYVADKAVTMMRRGGITQTALAKKMGRTQQYVSHILSGKDNLTLETISILGEALGTDLLREIFLEPEPGIQETPLLKDEPPTTYSSRYSSTLPTLTSIGTIITRFETGDRPFVLTCSDYTKYLCKAAKYTAGCQSLARELIGTVMANVWGVSDSPLALVRLLPQHTGQRDTSLNYALPCLGRKWFDDAVEISDAGHKFIKADSKTAMRLMEIALFDIWLSNEDRLNNNLNLLYSFCSGKILAIDHAGIFNTSFSSPLLQLSTSDSMLYSRLFEDVSGGKKISKEQSDHLETFFREKTNLCSTHIENIWKMIPGEWNIDKSDYDAIMDFIFSRKWCDKTLMNFHKILEECQL